jgi:hypothetical protein
VAAHVGRGAGVSIIAWPRIVDVNAASFSFAMIIRADVPVVAQSVAALIHGAVAVVVESIADLGCARVNQAAGVVAIASAERESVAVRIRLVRRQ